MLSWSAGAPRIVLMTQADVQISRIIETFEFLDDWEDRYRYLIDLGKNLKPMNPADRVEANRVHGCQATVWLKAQLNEQGQLELAAESDAFVVNGLIAILLSAFDKCTPSEILAFDVQSLFDRLGLVEHLSPTRRNGLYAMIGRIHEIAKQQEAV